MSGLMGQAVGVRREFGGMMSKPWRMVVLQVGAWIAFALLWRNGTLRVGAFTVLDWSCLLVIVGCLQTIAVRLRCTMNALAA